MDSITHIALGACMGEAFAGKKLGKKAMLWGALAQSFPDIDFLAAFWQDPAENLLAHRGFTHSILFSLVIAFILALMAEKWHRPHNISFRRWASFFGSVILAHIFLDAFNNYGVGWFEPFSHYRISFNAIYVADPFFSVIPGISCAMLSILRQKHPARKWWWQLGLMMCLLYTIYCLINKWTIDHTVRNMLAKQEIKYDRYLTTPAPFQNWLWFVAAGSDDGYHVGYRSLFDKSDTLHLHYFSAHRALLDSLPNLKEKFQLIRFSQGFYTVSARKDTLMFNDLRFGQVVGWENSKEDFVFHYYLEPAVDNTLVVQRGRFEKWDWETFKLFLQRVSGKEIAVD